MAVSENEMKQRPEPAAEPPAASERTPDKREAALAAFVAAFHSERASRTFLVTFGSYYALDATVWLLNGFVNVLPWAGDIRLNLPHVVVSRVMLGAAYGIESHATERAGTPAMA